MLQLADFPPHFRLLLLAARAHHTPAASAQLHALVELPTLDWSAFLATAIHHKLVPLCFTTFQRLQPRPVLPPEVHTELHRLTIRNTFAALKAIQQIDAITRHFHAAGIHLAVLKGVPLSQLLYNSPNARHVGDLDLLTSAPGLAGQIDLLAGLGFELINPTARLTPARTRSFARFWKDFTFTNPSTGFDLDLHWRLFNNRHHPANPILHAQPFASITVFNTPVRTLSRIDQFLYVVAHGTSDAWLYLKSLADVAAFLHLLTPTELAQATTRAQTLGLLPQLSAAIHLAKDWFGEPAWFEVPTSEAEPSKVHPLPAALAAILPPDEAFAQRLRARTESNLLRHDYRPERTHTSTLQWFLLELDLMPRLQALPEVLRRHLWRPRVWSRVDLPDHLFFLYPLLGLVLPPRPESLKP